MTQMNRSPIEQRKQPFELESNYFKAFVRIDKPQPHTARHQPGEGLALRIESRAFDTVD